MSNLYWLAPTGFLCLLGLIILLLIYIIKPNYQQRFVSSTFVWKLSLKFKKRKFPISRWRNLLIILCQIMIIVICASILAQPFLKNANAADKNEEIFILDASVSMYARQGADATCFERAVEEVLQRGSDAINASKKVTVIVAGHEAKYLSYTKTEGEQGEEAGQTYDILHCANLDLFKQAMGSLVVRNQLGAVTSLKCDYTVADIDGALELAQQIVDIYPNIKVTLVSANNYICTNVIIVNVSKRDALKYAGSKEWNAAVLDIRVSAEQDYYSFVVDVAAFNNNINFEVYLEVYDVVTESTEDPNLVEGSVEKLNIMADCDNNQIKPITFKTDIIKFSSARAYINVNDSLSFDNEFHFFSIKKEKIRMLYSSDYPSHSYDALLSTIANNKSQWDVQITSSSLSILESSGELSKGGFDFYIFEGALPPELPTDGIVLIFAPDSRSQIPDTDIVFGPTITRSSEETHLKYTYTKGEPSILLKYVQPILVNQYRKVDSVGSFTPILYTRDLQSGADEPILMVDESRKIAVFTISSYFTSVTMETSFYTFFYNFTKTWLPATFNQYVVDAGESLKFWQNDDDIIEYSKPVIEFNDGTVIRGEVEGEYSTIQKMNIGVYEMSQKLMSERIVKEKVFVKMASSASDFSLTTTLTALSIKTSEFINDLEMFLYLAIALVSFIFIERLLHAKSEL